MVPPAEKGREWAYRLDDTSSLGTKVNLFTMDDILQGITENNIEPFILKVDIEGGEQALFSQPAPWFDDFYISIVEIHDWLFPKKNIAFPVFKTITQHDNKDILIFGGTMLTIKHS